MTSFFPIAIFSISRHRMEIKMTYLEFGKWLRFFTSTSKGDSKSYAACPKNNFDFGELS